MVIDKYLTNDSILIVPNNIKNKILKNNNKLINTKYISFNEIKKKILFDYDTRTINYIMNKNNIDYSNSLELINNMYYLFEDKYTNKKIDNLNNLKKELIKNDLLIIDNYFKESLKNKTIYVYGYDYLNKYNLKLIDILKEYTSVTIIDKEEYNYTHPIYNFEHLNYEIDYIVNDILNKKLDLNHVYIYNINNDNENTIKRIFNNYNLNININSKISLYETKIGKDILNNINNEELINNIENNDIKKLIINILNKYYWSNNKEEVLPMLIYEFKNTYIPSIKYINSVNITNLFNDYFTDEDYIYVINFNNEYIPVTYKDTDFINDSEKFDFLETTNLKNNIEKNKWFNIIKNIKNLTITSSNQNYLSSLTKSTLINDYNYEVINIDYKPSIYSNKDNIYNLGVLLDNYNINNYDNISTLITTYPNHNYLSYSNKYTKINYKDNYSLSYTKLNTYYECSFKYYCDYILKLDKYEETFDTWVGSLCHDILSKIYNDDFNYEKVKEEFINNHYYELTNENKVFLNKILQELRFTINYLISFNNITKYQIIETEKNIETNINNTKFIGFIDKIMHYNNNVVLVDYKTGNIDIDLKLAEYGLNLQLPIYIYLIKTIYPKSNIVGLYLEHILMPLFNKEKDLTIIDQYEKSLKLVGYSLADENYLKDFDPTYENSNYIKGLKLTNNGFSHYSKLLSKDEFNNLLTLTENKINECINNINNSVFTISPKYYNNKNISCDYCPYKSVCFKTDKDNIYLTNGGETNEMD